MPAIVILGTQWGDEGKGKATDLLATTDTIDYSSAPAAATTPATRSSSTARSSRPTCCPAAS